jgi:hypothetical protein
MYIGLHVKYRLLLSDLIKLEYPGTFSKKSQITKLIQTRPVGGELLHTDRQMDGQGDTTKLTGAC